MATLEGKIKNVMAELSKFTVFEKDDVAKDCPMIYVPADGLQVLLENFLCEEYEEFEEIDVFEER